MKTLHKYLNTKFTRNDLLIINILKFALSKQLLENNNNSDLHILLREIDNFIFENELYSVLELRQSEHTL